ncbi:MAG TPA: FkbM family methyltransferase [Parvibaculum sp.]|jgi:FkbM family methyltransferase
MIVRTKTKIKLAHALQRVVMFGRTLLGLGHIAECRRGGLNWRLDLREGVDFSVFLLGRFEPDLIAAYERLVLPGSVIIDIGANIGSHTLPLAKQTGTTGHVIAVEPTLYAFEKLIKHAELNPDLSGRITPVQTMLMGDLQAVLSPAIESSWPLETPEGAHGEHAGVAKATTGSAVGTLDGLIAELGLKRVDVLKLDVDGYEVEVLRGALEVLTKFRPLIFFEHAPYVVREKGYDPDEMGAILTHAGYRFHDLHRHLLEGGGEKLPDVEKGAGINLLAISLD